jgi:PAS domain S-box-containing protein
MEDENKTKMQLINELRELRQRVKSTGVFCFGEEMAGRERVQEKLLAAEEKYLGIYENAIEGIFRTTPAGRVLDANPAFARIFGYDSPEEMKSAITDIGRQLYVDPETRKEWIAFVDRQEYGRFEVRMRNKSGAIGWICLRARPVRDLDGKTIYYEGFAEDVTQRKRTEEELTLYRDHLEELVKERTLQLENRNQQLIAEIAEREKVERALRESEMHYRVLFSHAGVAIVNLDARGNIISFNDGFVEFTGYSREELERIGGEDITHPDYIQQTEYLKAKQREGEIDQFMMEKCYIRKDGALRWGELRATPIRDEQGKFLSAVFAITDITERKRAEEALLESEKELRIKAQNLTEVNTTMNVLLRTMEKDQEELKERFLTNISEQVLPYLDKLKKTKLNDCQRGFLNMAESSLDEIASPFVQKLTSSYLNLTKKEIQVAALIKEGKTTKEIAELMNSSQRVIEFHRENIRAKLGIKNKKGNLQILLRSFS